jgi:DUF177 domain-containing protein
VVIKSGTVDLSQLSLSSGEGRRLELPVRPGSITLGGQSYGQKSQEAAARLDVSRTTTGHAFRLRFTADLAGPCVRCLEAASVKVEVDAREVEAADATEDELRSPYVDDDVLEVNAWAHDALTLALPPQILCRPDCAGLCPVCGVSLNEVDPASHEHPAEPDPRWAKLSEIDFE